MKNFVTVALTLTATLSVSNIFGPEARHLFCISCNDGLESQIAAILAPIVVHDGNQTSTEQQQQQQQQLRGSSLTARTAGLFSAGAAPTTADPIVTATPFVGNKPATDFPRFLLGFFSMASEVDRRQFMRDSVLRFYKDIDGDGNRTICALNDLLEQDIPECRFAYVFIIGGSEGPTRLLTSSDEQPIYTRNLLENEPDVVQLNIEENMNDGKTPTYYKYASIMAEQVSADYVAKVDLDTLLFVPNFVKYCQEQFPQTPLKDELQVYAGKPITSSKDGFQWVSGAFQILSTPLAKAVTHGPEADTIFAQHEDYEMSKRIEALGSNVSRIWIGNKQVKFQPSKTPDMRRATQQAYDFTNIVYGHTEWGKRKFSRFTPGPYFKHLPTARKAWRHFQYWYTNEMKPVDNIYHLYDLPAPNSKTGLVQTNDYIYSQQDFDSSPIVLEERKLIFFPTEGNGATEWRQLIRRILGKEDWRDETKQFEDLTFLTDFDPTKANEIMTSPDYTRAMIVQDPKSRLLSSYVTKVIQDESQEFMRTSCCGNMLQLTQPGAERLFASCSKEEQGQVSFELFVQLVRECDQPYWRPQSRRMEPKYYKYLNFVGHYETIQEDAMTLLGKIGIDWDEFGSSGWGEDGTDALFSSSSIWTVESAMELSPQEYDKHLNAVATDGKNIYRTDYEESILGLTA